MDDRQHHSVIIDLAGVESYRVKEAAKKQMGGTKTRTAAVSQ
jgi:hypothetical protein